MPPRVIKLPKSSSAAVATTTTSDESKILLYDQPLTPLQAKLNKQLQKIEPEEETKEPNVRRMRRTEPGSQRDILRRKAQTLPRSMSILNVDFTREKAPELAGILEKRRSKAEPTI